ncbi:MAG: PilZ domain-containing protein [Desulfuromonadales bacterium]|nr:PilZ domain-containing protein [Chloroflexota bacterium]MCK4621191.1 PilZ domain-containing protein [Desulfuromonadales bacterium]
MESRLKYQPPRAHQRFKAGPRALVLVDQGPEALPYHIMDISEGGLAFRYLGQKLKRSEVKEISLYHDYELIVDALPVQAVSDFRLQDNLVPVRRASITFKELKAEQKSKLERFIRAFTEAPLPFS